MLFGIVCLLFVAWAACCLFGCCDLEVCFVVGLGLVVVCFVLVVCCCVGCVVVWLWFGLLC